MKKLLISIAIMAMMVLPARAIETNWTWTVPTTGSPVHHYLFEIQIDGGEWDLVAQPTTNTTIYNMPEGVDVVVRVAGVDADDRTGPYSVISEVYFDAGAPGACGKPSWLP